MATRIVLVGAGHAHLHLLRHRLPVFAALGAETALVEPDSFWYSGLATGMVAGRHAPARDTIDPGPLLARGGGRWLRTRAVGLDRCRRRLLLADGGNCPYDVLSLNVGSVTTLPAGLPAADPRLWPIKPIAGLAALGAAIDRRPPATLVVVGGGASGVELALCLARRLRRRGTERSRLTLLTRSARLLGHPSPRLQRRLRRELACAGVALRRGELHGLEPGALRLADGATLPAGMVVLATGLRPPDWLAATGLPTRDGGLLVDTTLRSVCGEPVFATGDCAALTGHRLPRLGVFGVRQAPILGHNLVAAMRGRPLRHYRPQQRWLQLLDLGRSSGLLLYADCWLVHPMALWLKDRIDRGFLDRHRPPHRPDRRSGS